MKTELITLREGFEHGKSCFTQARVGLTPAEAVLATPAAISAEAVLANPTESAQSAQPVAETPVTNP